jgi:hypothetical protein
VSYAIAACTPSIHVVTQTGVKEKIICRDHKAQSAWLFGYAFGALMLSELQNLCAKGQKLKPLGEAVSDEDFQKLYRKTVIAREDLVGLLEEIISAAPMDLTARVAEAGILVSRLSESIGKSQERWNDLQEKNR